MTAVQAEFAEPASAGSPDLRLVDANTPSLGRLEPTLVWAALVASVLSWRVGAYYSGGVDPVVLAKALLSVVAVVAAWRLYCRSAARNPVGWRTPVFSCGYLAASLLGAAAGGTLFPSIILGVRIVIVLVAVAFLVAACPMATLLSTLGTAMGGIALVLAVAGLPSYAQTGRLIGGLLPVNPNEIAVLLSLSVLLAGWQLLNGGARRIDAAVLAAGFLVTWLTGSRTGLAALLIALALMAFLARQVPALVYAAVLACVPVLAYLSTSTGVLSAFVSRGNAETVWTLSNRTVAWSAAFHSPASSWVAWFGGGLSVKTVAVSGVYWDTQVIDNSWVSAFVKGGYVAMGLLVLWMLTTLAAALKCRRGVRAFWLPVVIYLVICSITSSGLMDADVLFMLAVVAASATDAGLGCTGRSLIPPAHVTQDGWGRT